MKIFYFTTVNPKLQGDYQEVMTAIGMRELLGDRFIDYPKKKVLYGDFTDTPKESLHGMGFTLYSRPIKDIKRTELNITPEDAILYSTAPSQYNNPRYYNLEKLTKKIWTLDGQDYPDIETEYCFKRELANISAEMCKAHHIYPTGFSIPEYLIRDFDLSIKKKIFPSSTPTQCISADFSSPNGQRVYKFDNEADYFKDLSESFIGLTCKRGGWDALRHYEIIAAGTPVLFRDYDKKPEGCSPRNLPTFSYSNTAQLEHIVFDILLPGGKPSDEYLNLIKRQQKWLRDNATCLARAKYIYSVIQSDKR